VTKEFKFYVEVVSCDSSEIVTGGGASCITGVSVKSSGPSGNGWRAQCTDQAAALMNSVTAICCKM
jgi:hypothetical protein